MVYAQRDLSLLQLHGSNFVPPKEAIVADFRMFAGNKLAGAMPALVLAMARLCFLSVLVVWCRIAYLTDMLSLSKNDETTIPIYMCPCTADRIGPCLSVFRTRDCECSSRTLFVSVVTPERPDGPLPMATVEDAPLSRATRRCGLVSTNRMEVGR